MQEILGLVRRCVEDYDMIQSGDTVAVGVSGGKDSLLTLTALARLSRFYPKPFRVVAMTIEAGTPGMSFDGVADYCRALGVEYIRVSVPIYEVVFLERREKNPCSLCAKLRRGALSTAMNEHGIRKIALGHHYDDAVETMLMNLLFEGRIGCFQPVTYLDRSSITQIRPLLYCHEDEVRRAAEQVPASLFLIDAVSGLHLKGEERGIIHGDALCYSIAAASIVAKVTRDRQLIALDRLYPDYGFARNKGYGTAEHIAALKRLGPCPEHRRSFIGHFWP